MGVGAEKIQQLIWLICAKNIYVDALAWSLNLMKIKELPLSLYTVLKLRFGYAKELKKERDLLPLVISLTSIPERLGTLHLTILSLLVQTTRARKIVLWLNESLKASIPDALAALVGDEFEIRYVSTFSSHRKLVHSLDAFPQEIIVTCDDDLMYRPQWLELLYRDHLLYPKDVIAHECRTIATDGLGNVMPYEQWLTETEFGVTRPWLMPIGYGGVLYPVGCFHTDVVNQQLFLALTPKADDLWFKAMSYLHGVNTRRVSHGCGKPIPILGSQKVSLKHTNVRQNGNYLQWLALVKYYRINICENVESVK